MNNEMEEMVKSIGLYKHKEFTVDTLLKMQKLSKINNNDNDNNNVILTMSKRLQQLEPLCIKQENIINNLNNELDSIKLQLNSNQKQMTEELLNTKRQLLRYQRQVYDMETFLNDYRLIWAGFRADVEEDDDEVINNNIEIDFDNIINGIKILNNLAGQGEMTISTNGSKARFVPSPSLSLILFQDGLFLGNGPLRDYNTESCQKFIDDILDQYFPFELKDKYPDGVVFDLQDQRNIKFSPNTIYRYIRSPTSLQLPKTTVRNGKVIDISGENNFGLRSDDIISPSCNTTTLVRTPTLSLLEQNSEFIDKRPSTPQDITTIRVKYQSKTLLIKCRFYETIGDLRKYLCQEIKDDFIIRTSFPRRIYQDNNITLKDAGLIPNATILIQHL